jgi:predicted NBD/HSP70 family sugar kinase
VLRSHGVPGADLRQAVAHAAAAAAGAATGTAADDTVAGTPTDTSTNAVTGTTAGPAIGAEVGAEGAGAALREVAARLAVGLAAITSVMDPGLILLTGGVALAGGETLRELIEEELHALTIARPQVRLSAVRGNPVLAGALDLALATVRDEIFDSTGARR